MEQEKQRESKSFLIVGLGNPGKEYEETRHNIGFQVVTYIAKEWGVTFKRDLSITKSKLAKAVYKENKVLLLMPLTYMNQSGTSVRMCKDYYNVPLEQLLVVSDEVELPFGMMRMRAKGSPGGHNGLKSIEAHLNSQDYPRLRIGVGKHEDGQQLADYVLDHFSKEEKKELPQIWQRGKQAIEMWIEQGIEAAMRIANIRSHLGE